MHMQAGGPRGSFNICSSSEFMFSFSLTAHGNANGGGSERRSTITEMLLARVAMLALQLASAITHAAPLQPRALHGSELFFAWREWRVRNDSSREPLPWQAHLPTKFSFPLAHGGQQTTLHHSHVFHPDRWQSVHCLHDASAHHAFALSFDAPCLATPSHDDWYQLLRGRTLAFVGDSTLRDHYFLLVATLLSVASERNLTPSGTFGIHGFGALHPGTKPLGSWVKRYAATSILHMSVASADGREPPTRLLWSWYTDTKAAMRDPRFSAAEVYVMHHGSHERPAAFANRLSPPTVLTRDITRLRAQGIPVIWVEYAAAHFPWGAGEFEDDRSPSGLERLAGRTCCHSSTTKSAPPPEGRAGSCINASASDCNLRSCRPLGKCASPLATARLTLLRDAYVRAGALVLPMWDMSAGKGGHAEHNHIVAGSLTPGQRKNFGVAGTLLDCRHYCNPGSMTVGWSRRLFTMLASPPAAAVGQCVGLGAVAARVREVTSTSCNVTRGEE